jgi:hypothetical protein
MQTRNRSTSTRAALDATRALLAIAERLARGEDLEDDARTARARARVEHHVACGLDVDEAHRRSIRALRADVEQLEHHLRTAVVVARARLDRTRVHRARPAPRRARARATRRAPSSARSTAPRSPDEPPSAIARRAEVRS